MGRLNYREISKKKIKDNRNVVISEAYNKDDCKFIGYSIAEQLEMEDIKVFLRGGLGIVGKEGLMSLKEAIDEACEKLCENEEEKFWNEEDHR